MKGLIVLLKDFCKLDAANLDGLGCLVSEQFQIYVHRQNMKSSDETVLIGLDDKITSFLE